MKQQGKYTLKSEKSESVMQTPRTPHKNAIFRKSNIRSSLQISLTTPKDEETFPLTDKSYQILYKNDFIFKEISDNYFETNYRIIKKIGQGDYYEVFIANHVDMKDAHIKCMKDDLNTLLHSTRYCKCSTKLTCVKKSKKSFTGDTNKKNRLKEIQILNVLKGKSNIIQIRNSWEEKGRLYVETELCGYGNLKDFINHVYYIDQTKFTLKVIKKIVSEVAFGLTSVHKYGIVHMDLKPENIFIKSNRLRECRGNCYCRINTNLDNYSFVVGDFNISKFNVDEIYDDGDKKYMPGEILLNQAYSSSDIFSLGLIFLEMALGIVLPSTGDDWLNLRKNNFKDLKFEKINVKMKNIIVKMIDKDPNKRPTAGDVIELLSCL